eukprot:CAMPEP_0172512650 /NCGR_PEP_ID=MMETSP1066-20121228/246215_1 /TAXON_ID=671091 /ORGANISM="Coscinodiscus wailesii, Strain CCMP2513" /LENGTH=630 /DNA_ID=CAMNT_0013292563 /DNA_START=193 /DNA_END=2085 /DNA_ORIENTATION=+
MLSLHSSTPPSTPTWKILIYDAPCRAIISPLLSVSQLRSRGVTLHLLLSSPREPIPDVPAVYFCEPTRANLNIISQDLANGLYAKSYLNFSTRLPRHLMEEFAKLVVKSGSEALNRVASIHDLYLDFVCLERNLFTLNKKGGYVRYNGSGASEETITKEMEEVAYGLFSVVASMNTIPIIRCPRGGAPEMVARKLNRMIAENPTMSRVRTTSRPLLIILDRNADLVTPIQHTSTYQALIDDVLKHNANRVEFSQEQEKPKKPITKKYDLDPDTDPFYSMHKFNPFPEAIESQVAELQNVSEREAEIRSKTTGNANDTHAPAFDSQATELSKTISSLPALLEHKKQLELHTSILQAVMNEVAKRDIPVFYEVESALATGVYNSDPAGAKKATMELLADTTKGSIWDKIRLLSTYTLTIDASLSDVEELGNALKQSLIAQQEGGPTANLKDSDKKLFESGLRAVSYLKKLRSINTMDFSLQDSASNADASNAAPANSKVHESTMLSSFMARAQTQATGLLAKATEKVGTMLGKVHKHYITKVVENLCEYRGEDEAYLYLDPKIKGEVDVTQIKREMMVRGYVKEVVAFMIGAGCYAEYQNLVDLIGSGRRVSYGCTELCNAEGFLHMLGELG